MKVRVIQPATDRHSPSGFQMKKSVGEKHAVTCQNQALLIALSLNSA